MGPFRLVLAFLLLVLFASGEATGQARRPATLSDGIRAKIQELQAEKRARTPAQRKIDSRLLRSSRIQRGLPVAAAVRAQRGRVAVDAQGRTEVDLRARVSLALLAEIERLGGEVVNHFAAWDAVRARIPLGKVEALAARDDVLFVRPADAWASNRVNISEGDVAHRADVARLAKDLDGAGVTVGVLSDGVATLAARIATGDIPAGTAALPGQAGAGDEGTAMLEIVHDLAPGAGLLFATALGGQANFASNILALRTAGADIIVDDIGYFAEAVFMDGTVAAAVNSVNADGALYFSSAGNSGNLNDGTSGVWEGDYLFSGFTLNGEDLHDFTGSGDFDNTITKDAPFFFTLQWSDAQGASANDYDLYLADAGLTTIFDSSTNPQDGDDDPFEIIDSQAFNDTGNVLLVTRFSGAPRYLQLNTIRGELEFATDGQTSGHAAAADAFGVAAVDARFPGGAAGEFDGSESVEAFSSDGPRRVFYDESGVPITPGDFSSTGGEVRQKPDLAAADCVMTSTPGFNPFCGTSAAAPHAAAIAALGLEDGHAPEAMRDVLTNAALDIEAPGFDRDSGAGILMADSLVLTPECGDGVDNDADGLIDAGADPGCFNPNSMFEDPQCNDGIDNDSDGGIDFDGAPPDLQCTQGWRVNEAPLPMGGECGLGGEFLVGMLALLGWRRASRRGDSARPMW